MKAPRSLLYVPAASPSMLQKIPSLAADAFVVDLEDGISAQQKESARELLREAAAARLIPENVPWMLRVNGVGSAGHEDDLSLAEALHPPLVLVPKAEDPEEVCDLADWFSGHGSGTALMIETARGVAAARELAACHERIAALVVGSADLRMSLRARPDDERGWERHALGEILLAARASDVLAIDSVYFRFRDDEGLRRHASIARGMGYDGKSCIHPSQIPVIHEVFAPTMDELGWARRVVDAWRTLDGERRGVLVVDGEMIEALHVTVAARILERSGA
ncbi:MAG TPA: CoA ester lyase [Candidatus Polarisedimenticolaceae bacterium]